MKKLKYGETPWDDMSREELLRTVERMWCAMIELESVTGMMKGLDAGPFWGKRGTGGRALEMSRQIRAAIDCEHGSEGNEQLYRCFFRYAQDLLFDGSTGFRMGPHWMVCDKDGNCWARGHDEPPPTTCSLCDGPLRPLEWKDIMKKSIMTMERLDALREEYTRTRLGQGTSGKTKEDLEKEVLEALQQWWDQGCKEA